METPESFIKVVTYVKSKFFESFLCSPPTHSLHSGVLAFCLSTVPPRFLFRLPWERALETEWSECELTIVEINGIWSTGHKEWQSLDSKWAKRVVRTRAVLVIRKGWGEREMERWRKGRRPVAVCSGTKCWIMRSDWHDPQSWKRQLWHYTSPYFSIPLSTSYMFFFFLSVCLSMFDSPCLTPEESAPSVECESNAIRALVEKRGGMNHGEC